jgi:hypothetical protein
MAEQEGVPIEDFMDMTLKLVEDIQTYDTVNIAYGESYDIKQILDWLFKIENFWPKVIYDEQFGSAGDVSAKLNELFGARSRFLIN